MRERKASKIKTDSVPLSEVTRYVLVDQDEMEILQSTEREVDFPYGCFAYDSEASAIEALNGYVEGPGPLFLVRCEVVARII